MARLRRFVPDLPVPLPQARVSGIDAKGKPAIYYIAFDGYRDPHTGRRRWGFLAEDLIPAPSGEPAGLCSKGERS